MFSIKIRLMSLIKISKISLLTNTKPISKISFFSVLEVLLEEEDLEVFVIFTKILNTFSSLNPIID
jgi:hypothetical protein